MPPVTEARSVHRPSSRRPERDGEHLSSTTPLAPQLAVVATTTKALADHATGVGSIVAGA